MAHKPDGHTALAPYLLVADAEAELAFCETVFGAERLRVFREGDRIVHGECRIDDTVLMLAAYEGPAAMLHVYVPDPDATQAKALSLGAEELQPVMEKGDGDRRGGFRSPAGTLWYVARQL